MMTFFQIMGMIFFGGVVLICLTILVMFIIWWRAESYTLPLKPGMFDFPDPFVEKKVEADIKSPVLSFDIRTRVKPAPWFKPTVSSHLTDANSKISEIYVASDAVGDVAVRGSTTYSETITESNPVKLVRSGTGFRIYNHPKVVNGKWLSCR